MERKKKGDNNEKTKILRSFPLLGFFFFFFFFVFVFWFCFLFFVFCFWFFFFFFFFVLHEPFFALLRHFVLF